MKIRSCASVILLYAASVIMAPDLMAQSDVSFVTSSDNVRIAYAMYGKGKPALILVHGSSCDRSYWRYQTEPFSKEFTVVAVDLAGHGQSGTERRDWSQGAFGDDVASVVQALNLDEVILIGHSMGGDVIAEAALRLPGRVKGMIMIDTYKSLGSGRSPESVQSFLEPFHSDFTEAMRTLVLGMFVSDSDPTLVEWVANDMASAPPAVAIPVIESAFGYSRQMPYSLQKLNLPVIAINPDNRPTDISSMEQHGVEVMIIPGLGHFPQMEDPERFNEVLKAAVLKFK